MGKDAFTCWLVEHAGFAQPAWFAVMGRAYGWSVNANEAVKFADKASAEALIHKERLHTVAFASQHCWPDGLGGYEGPLCAASEIPFAEALLRVQSGERLCRAGWNGKGMYIELQRPDEHSKMTLPYIYMRTVQGDLVPWLASQTDILAKDWKAFTPVPGQIY